MWTRFFDLSTCGLEKTDWSIIYIELPKDEAIEYFENRFDVNPNAFSCECCGKDFSIEEVNGEPLASNNVLIIRNSAITQLS